MVTEPIELIIREKGAAATSRKIDRVGRSSRTAAKAVTGLVAALGLIVAVRALSGLAKDAIAASAAFESYGVQLRGLLGSQEEANKALETFVELSSSTPFAVAQIVEGASALAASALGNRKKLEELTQTAANIAAATGLGFAAAAENLARSLQAGIGAADLFREKGVRPLIESILGIPDATKLSAKELEGAFKDVFGTGGVFGEAAEQLSFTLGGALSNIGDAAANFKVELGDALSPTVINAARGIFIPFFKNLQKTVLENSEDINDFAAGSISGLISAFVISARAGLVLAETFGTIRKFGRDFVGMLLEVNLGLARADVAILEFFDIGEVNENTKKFIERERLAQAAVDDFALSARKGDIANEKFKKTLDGINLSLADLERLTSKVNLAAALPEIKGGPSAEDLTAGSKEGVKTTEQIKAIAKAEKELLALTRAITIDRIAGDDPLERQRILIDEQIAAVVRLTDVTGDQVLQEQLVNDLLTKRAALGGEETTGTFQAGVAEAFTAGLENAIAGGDVLKSVGQSLSDQLKTSATEGLAQGIKDGVEALSEGFTGAFESIAESMPDIFGDTFKGMSEEFGAALGAALQFAASLALDAILGGGGNKSSSGRGNVSSAVSSSAAIRGIVAGPQEIAIAQVGSSIASAIDPLLDETILQTFILSEIRDNITGSGGIPTIQSVSDLTQLATTNPGA